MAAADNTVKLSKKHRSNSVKVAALTALKSWVSPGQISKELEIPPSTLRQWRKVSMESGDSGIARPAPRKDDEEDCEASAPHCPATSIVKIFMSIEVIHLI